MSGKICVDVETAFAMLGALAWQAKTSNDNFVCGPRAGDGTGFYFLICPALPSSVVRWCSGVFCVFVSLFPSVRISYAYNIRPKVTSAVQLFTICRFRIRFHWVYSAARHKIKMVQTNFTPILAWITGFQSNSF